MSNPSRDLKDPIPVRKTILISEERPYKKKEEKREEEDFSLDLDLEMT